MSDSEALLHELLEVFRSEAKDHLDALGVLLVTLEESVVTGGFGSGVLELLEEARLADPAYRDVAVRIVGIPAERFVDHGSVDQLRHLLRLDAAGIADQIRETLVRLRAVPGGSKPAARSGARTPAK